MTISMFSNAARRPLTIVCLIIAVLHESGIASASGGSWSIVRSPSPGGHANYLAGIVAISPNDVWAVGAQAEDSIVGALDQSLTEHWNGSTWSVVPSPGRPDSVTNDLVGVAAISSTNVWAVGTYGTYAGLQATLVEHWNGSTWTVVPSPNAGYLGSGLLGVTTVPGTNTLWATGFYLTGSGTEQTLIERYDGSGWTIVPSPNVGASYNELHGVVAISPTDVWTVGTYYTGYSTMPVTARTLVEHWSGSTWTVVPSPNHDTAYGQDHNILWSVTRVPGTNTMWAVGDSVLDVPPGAMLDQPLIEYFNGTSWKLSNVQLLLPESGGLVGMTAISASDAWAVGSYNPGSGFDATLIEHWNGTAWSIVPSPNTGVVSRLIGVTSIGGTGQVWADGQYGNLAGNTNTLIEMNPSR